MSHFRRGAVDGFAEMERRGGGILCFCEIHLKDEVVVPVNRVPCHNPITRENLQPSRKESKEMIEAGQPVGLDTQLDELAFACTAANA